MDVSTIETGVATTEARGRETRFSHLISTEATDIGLKRRHNEDCVLRMPEAGVFCVADGMGGARGGALASRWTIDALENAFRDRTDTHLTADRIQQAINDASIRIKAMADERCISGAGTTVVAMAFDNQAPDRALILHAGDSRAYRLRLGRLQLLTQDHSLAELAGVKHDRFLPQAFRGVITRCVGLEACVPLETTQVSVAEGDLFVLCSDGVNKMVTDTDLEDVLNTCGGLALPLLAQRIIDEANKAGGEDNSSVVLIKVGAGPGVPDALKANKPKTGRVRVNHPETSTSVMPSTMSVCAKQAPKSVRILVRKLLRLYRD